MPTGEHTGGNKTHLEWMALSSNRAVMRYVLFGLLRADNHGQEQIYCMISQRSSLGSELYLATGMHTQLGPTLIVSQDSHNTGCKSGLANMHHK